MLPYVYLNISNADILHRRRHSSCHQNIFFVGKIKRLHLTNNKKPHKIILCMIGPCFVNQQLISIDNPIHVYAHIRMIERKIHTQIQHKSHQHHTKLRTNKMYAILIIPKICRNAQHSQIDGEYLMRTLRC